MGLEDIPCILKEHREIDPRTGTAYCKYDPDVPCPFRTDSVIQPRKYFCNYVEKQMDSILGDKPEETG